MIIREFLPNPVGADKDGEYIKIFNDTDVAVNLSGWKISDASGKAFNLSGTIKSKEELVLTAIQTKISLNNNGETISLFNSNGILVDKLGYVGVAEEGKVVINEKIIEVKSQFENGQILNNNFQPALIKIIGLDLFLALILGTMAVYVILQLEKRLDRKLYE